MTYKLQSIISSLDYQKLIELKLHLLIKSDNSKIGKDRISFFIASVLYYHDIDIVNLVKFEDKLKKIIEILNSIIEYDNSDSINLNFNIDKFNKINYQDRLVLLDFAHKLGDFYSSPKTVNLNYPVNIGIHQEVGYAKRTIIVD